MENFISLNHILVLNNKYAAFDRFKTICCISTTNLVAFSSEIDIFTAKRGFYVFVFDVNLPWSAYKIVTIKYKVTTIDNCYSHLGVAKLSSFQDSIIIDYRGHWFDNYRIIVIIINIAKNDEKSYFSSFWVPNDYYIELKVKDENFSREKKCKFDCHLSLF